MHRIITYPDPFLRKKSIPVDKFDNDLKKIVTEMAAIMYKSDGIGLAAPQIGVSQQIIVIGQEDKKSYRVFINPQITYYSDEEIVSEEGCLSLPNIFGMVSRPKKIHLKWQDIDGKINKATMKGMEAIVAQHEFDHLVGILFIDKATNITKGQDILDKLTRQ